MQVQMQTQRSAAHRENSGRRLPVDSGGQWPGEVEDDSSYWVSRWVVPWKV